MGNTNQGAGSFSGEINEAALKKWPMRFHNIHSENIGLSPDRRKAQRLESFCMGICFGERPVLINERIYLKFSDVSLSWSGVIRFGFTSNDPLTVNPVELPRYACPDLTNQPGFWAKALPERYAEQGNVLFFYLTRSGSVMFGLNDEEKGMFFNSVNAYAPLWPLVDIYGNTTSMEFIDGKQMNNITPSSAVLQQKEISQALSGLAISGAESSVSPTPTVIQSNPPSNLCTAQSMPTLPTNLTLAGSNLPIRHHSHCAFSPMPFLQGITGCQVALSADCLTAVRAAGEYCNAYVFTNRPLLCGECLVIQVLAADQDFHGGLAFGLTACDPLTLSPQSLPDDSDLLLDRPEYWVVNKDVYSPAEVGDELSFHLTESGELRYCKNRHPVGTLMFVDKTLPLWAFFDVYGNTQKIKSLGIVTGTLQTNRAHTVRTPGGDHRGSVSMASNNPPGTVVVAGGQGAGSAGLTVALPPPRSQEATTPVRPPPRPPMPRSASPNASAIAPPDRVVKTTPPAQLPARATPLTKQQSLPASQHLPGNILDMATPPRLPPKQLQHHLHSQRPIPPQLPPFDQILMPTPVKSSKPQSVKSPPVPPQPATKPAVPARINSSTSSTTPSSTQPTPNTPPLVQRNVPTPSNTALDISQSAPTSSTTSPAHQIGKASGTTSETESKDSPTGGAEDDSSGSGSIANECAVCFERAIDCVLYTCGHMCCCYTCAQDICENQGRLCPICRNHITDIIRTYRS